MRIMTASDATARASRENRADSLIFIALSPFMVWKNRLSRGTIHSYFGRSDLRDKASRVAVHTRNDEPRSLLYQHRRWRRRAPRYLGTSRAQRATNFPIMSVVRFWAARRISLNETQVDRLASREAGSQVKVTR